MSVRIITSLDELQAFARTCKANGKKIGAVPTMGFLHDGHAALIRHCVPSVDVTIVTLFVNPAQFNERSDLDRYPRDFEHDAELVSSLDVDVLFAPTPEEMYPQDFTTTVRVNHLSSTLEGEHRSGHFDGVATIVTKLLLATKADIAFFGQKDFQQVAVIRQMVRDLNIDCSIHAVPTVREHDGLALSSRNTFLSEDERVKATVVYRALHRATNSIKSGIVDSDELARIMGQVLQAEDGVTVEYAVAVDAKTLQYKELFRSGDTIALLIAARLGSVRLIDNDITIVP
jgi:pantoate--beta-alanine ligase